MKRPLYILITLIMASGLTACGKKKQSESIRGRCSRGACAADTQQGNPDAGSTGDTGTVTGSGEVIGGTSNTTWGQMHKGNATQAQFYEGLEGLVSANINSYGDPSELGYVSGDVDQNTGVWFWGDVRTTSGYFNPQGNQSAQIETSSAELRIVVWDAYAGKTDAAGNVIPEYPIHIRGASRGYISGKNVTLRFEDDYGYIELVGTYDSNYYSGTVSYQNKVFWDGGIRQGVRGAKGVLGYFYVETCGFFRCSQ